MQPKPRIGMTTTDGRTERTEEGNQLVFRDHFDTALEGKPTSFEQIVEGDFASAGQQASKITPVFGVVGAERTGQVLGDAADLISRTFSSWNYKGDK